MALSFFMWERHALQPAAQRHFGQRITGLQHFGSFACVPSTGEGAATGTGDRPRSRSRHATADALDIAGFTLQNGRRMTVLQDWKDVGAGAEARLLSEAHDGACRFFPGVLGPAYNAVHSDLCHLETIGYSMCG